jgi:hypothetical protein
MLVEPFDVRVAAQKPEQLVNDGLGVDLFRGEQRKTSRKSEPDLRAKHGIRAGARAVGLELAVFEDVPQQIEVLNHRGVNLTAKPAKDTKRNSIAATEIHIGILKLHYCEHQIQLPIFHPQSAILVHTRILEHIHRDLAGASRRDPTQHLKVDQ